MTWLIATLRLMRKQMGWLIWLVAPLYVFFELFLSNIQLLTTGLGDVQTSVDAIRAGAAIFPQIEMVWRGANYFFPVQAALAMAMWLLQLRLIAAVVRMIKTSFPLLWS